MKLSIVTITLNDGALLSRCVDSVRSQSLLSGQELEHIIVDGGSEASRLDIGNASVLHVPPRGCYNAINAGIKACTGDVIGLVHGTDFFADSNAAADILQAFAGTDVDFVFGDVAFVKSSTPKRIRRYYSARNFVPSELAAGFAPPHPSLFITADAQQQTGLYREDFRVAADFEFFIRLFDPARALRWRYLSGAKVIMDSDGRSASLKARLITNTREKRRALRLNGINTSYLRLLMRYFHYFRR